MGGVQLYPRGILNKGTRGKDTHPRVEGSRQLPSITHTHTHTHYFKLEDPFSLPNVIHLAGDLLALCFRQAVVSLFLETFL